MEPLFDPSSVTLGARYTLFPISPQEEDLYKFYKKAVATFWTVEEIDFSKDREDWEKLSDSEQYFIKHVLAFFAGSDGIVQENLASRFQREIASPVARLFYGMQNAMEGIHSETYSLLIHQKKKTGQIVSALSDCVYRVRPACYSELEDLRRDMARLEKEVGLSPWCCYKRGVYYTC